MKTKGTKKFTKIPIQTSIYMSYLYLHGQVNISEIVKMYPTMPQEAYTDIINKS